MREPLRYISLYSGVEAASLAFAPLGFEAVAFAEVEPFCSQLLAHRFPSVPNLGDVTTVDWGEYHRVADVLIGGFPCQAFSVAGLRRSLADDRGNLSLTYVKIADAIDPDWCIAENVPGWLSTRDNAFGCFLAGIVGEDHELEPPGGRWTDAGMVDGPRRTAAWRVLDAQYFGVAQRRRRVFVLACRGSGNWRCAAALFPVGEGLSGNPAPRRETREAATADAVAGAVSSKWSKGTGGPAGDEAYNLIANPLASRTGGFRQDLDNDTYIPHALRADGFDASEDGAGRGTPIVASPLTANYRKQPDNSDATVPNLIAFNLRGREGGAMPEETDVASVRSSSGGSSRSYVLGEKSDGYAEETHAIQMLRALRDAVGEETLCEWGLGIVAAFWLAEVLRSKVHGRSVRFATQPKRGLVNVALSRSQIGSCWTVRDLWEAGCDGCPPQGWRPSEQLSRELGAYLSKLPHAPSPAQRFMRALWETDEGAGLLREALSAVQEVRRSEGVQTQPAHAFAVRRLIVEECEALQGFPRGYTLIPYRGKPAADGPRYRAIGNSFAVPVISWIGKRIQMINALDRVTDRVTGDMPDDA